MLEFEIKLQVPAAARAELAAELLKRSPENLRKQRLQAVYFDTPSRHLAAEDMALRLRREGRNWVQTLKEGRSSDGMLREEDNVRLSERSAAEPALDLARHHNSAAGRRLQRILENAAGEGLQRRFATDVRRQSQIQRTRRGFVELSLDEGWVSTTERRLALRELEIESVKGSPLAVLEAASGYVKRYGLWIDLRSKAQRGHLLADQRDHTAPRKAGSIALSAQASLEEVLAAIFADCRRQVLQNASQIAAQEGHAPEHVHQIRVGLRRLRTALKLFEARTTAQSHWHEHARSLAALLGESRDRDVLAEQLWPRLREIHAPLIELPSPNDLSSPQEVVRRREVQLWFLEWIEHGLHLQLGIERGFGAPCSGFPASARARLRAPRLPGLPLTPNPPRSPGLRRLPGLKCPPGLSKARGPSQLPPPKGPPGLPPRVHRIRRCSRSSIAGIASAASCVGALRR